MKIDLSLDAELVLERYLRVDDQRVGSNISDIKSLDGDDAADLPVVRMRELAHLVECADQERVDELVQGNFVVDQQAVQILAQLYDCRRRVVRNNVMLHELLAVLVVQDYLYLPVLQQAAAKSQYSGDRYKQGSRYE